MNQNLVIDPKRIRRAAIENPCSKKVLETLFPEVFDSEKIFCRIGTIIKRKKYPDNAYAIFKWNGEVRFLNITHNSFWKDERNVKVSQLSDPEGETITRSEFRRLVGMKDLDDFIIVDNI